MYCQILLPDGSTDQNQHNMTGGPSGRHLVYVQQRFQSPQAMYEQYHARIIEVPHNMHSQQFSAITYGSHGSQFMPQISTQIVPYNPTANVEVSRFQGG